MITATSIVFCKLEKSVCIISLQMLILLSQSSEKDLIVLIIIFLAQIRTGFPGGSERKVSVHSVRDLSLVPGLVISPREGNGYSLQYSCLENSMDRGTLWATVHGVTKSQTQLSNEHTLTKNIQPKWLRDFLRIIQII